MEEVAAEAAIEVHREFSEVLGRHRGIVVKVASMYCRHPDDRADLLQEIATQLWRAWPTYDRARSVTTWMYRVALNVAISFVRSQSRRQRGAVALDVEHDIADEHGRDPEADE